MRLEWKREREGERQREGVQRKGESVVSERVEGKLLSLHICN